MVAVAVSDRVTEADLRRAWAGLPEPLRECVKALRVHLEALPLEQVHAACDVVDRTVGAVWVRAAAAKYVPARRAGE